VTEEGGPGHLRDGRHPGPVLQAMELVPWILHLLRVDHLQ
jgi:hypothetical protein